MLIKTQCNDAIMNFLKKDFLINENIIGIVENLPDSEIYVDNVEHPAGVLVKKDGYMHYVYTKDDSFIDNICENYFKEGFFGFSGVEGELAEKIRSRYLLGWESRCTLYYMPKENFDPSLQKNPAEKIRLEDAEIVDHFYQYRDPGTLEIIKRDITNRPSSAIYMNDEPVCWVLIHDDNSMGIMYTKEEHRRKGYAIDVTIDLVKQIFERGKIPFIQIVQGNGMSPGLAKKCGFVEYGKADWFGIVAGMPNELIQAVKNGRQMFLDRLPEKLRPCVYDEGISYAGMFCLLHSLKPIEDSSIKLVKVDNERNRTLWCDITTKALKGSTDTKEVKKILLETAEDENFNMYLLFQDGLAIAAATTYRYEEEDRGIYLLSILPEYESTNVIKLLVSETARYEKSNNCYFMTLTIEEKYRDAIGELEFREAKKE